MKKCEKCGSIIWRNDGKCKKCEVEIQSPAFDVGHNFYDETLTVEQAERLERMKRQNIDNNASPKFSYDNRCTKCGAELVENAIFCVACGTKIEKESPTYISAETEADSAINANEENSLWDIEPVEENSNFYDDFNMPENAIVEFSSISSFDDEDIDNAESSNEEYEEISFEELVSAEKEDNLFADNFAWDTTSVVKIETSAKEVATDGEISDAEVIASETYNAESEAIAESLSEATTKQCPVCGEILELDAIFCTLCGFKVGGKTATVEAVEEVAKAIEEMPESSEVVKEAIAEAIPESAETVETYDAEAEVIAVETYSAEESISEAVEEATTKQCPICGEILEADALFCTLCGFNVGGKSAKEAVEEVGEAVEDIPASLEAVEETIAEEMPTSAGAVEETIAEEMPTSAGVVETYDEESEASIVETNNAEAEVIAVETYSAEESISDAVEDATTKQCPICGEILEADALFCTLCGFNVGGKSAKEAVVEVGEAVEDIPASLEAVEETIAEEMPTSAGAVETYDEEAEASIVETNNAEAEVIAVETNNAEESNSEAVEEATTKQCPICGEILEADALFCTLCGFNVGGKSAKEAVVEVAEAVEDIPASLEAVEETIAEEMPTSAGAVETYDEEAEASIVETNNAEAEVIAVETNNAEESNSEAVEEATTKQCPICGEILEADALFCTLCGFNVGGKSAKEAVVEVAEAVEDIPASLEAVEETIAEEMPTSAGVVETNNTEAEASIVETNNAEAEVIAVAYSAEESISEAVEEATTKQCPVCGEILELDAIFCTLCGFKVGGKTATVESVEEVAESIEEIPESSEVGEETIAEAIPESAETVETYNADVETIAIETYDVKPEDISTNDATAEVVEEAIAEDIPTSVETVETYNAESEAIAVATYGTEVIADEVAADDAKAEAISEEIPATAEAVETYDAEAIAEEIATDDVKAEEVSEEIAENSTSNGLVCENCREAFIEGANFCIKCGGKGIVPPEVLVCEKCNTFIPNGNSSCANCGGNAVKKTGVLFCEKCGKMLAHGAKFCIKCGGKGVYVPKTLKCKKCGAELLSDANFCIGCGTKVSEPSANIFSGVINKFLGDNNSSVEIPEFCEVCGNSMKGLWKCELCGWKAQGATAPSTVEVYDGDCKICGTSMKGQQKCNVCGWVFKAESKPKASVEGVCEICDSPLNGMNVCSVCGRKAKSAFNSDENTREKGENASLEKSDVVNAVKCRKCGNDLRKGHPFCSMCGSRVNEDGSLKFKPVVCEKCFGISEFGHPYCSFCGEKLVR